MHGRYFRTLVALSVLSFVLLIQAAGQAITSLADRRAQLREAIEQEWQYDLKTSPELATAIGDARYNDQLADRSAEAAERDVQHARESIRVFEAIDTTGFPAQEALNKTLMLRQLHDDLDTAQFHPWEMPVNQMNGDHLDLAALPSQMPFNTVKDYENYLARLHAMPHALDQDTVNMKQGLKDHLMPPKYLLEKVTSEAQDIANKPLAESPFTAPLKQFPSSVSAPDQRRLTQSIEAAVKDEVNPAFAKFAAFVRDDYAPHGRLEYGIWSLPNGEAQYRVAVRQMTTTNLTPAEIHAMGLKQVTEIDAQMLALAQSLGFHDLKSFNDHIRKDPDHYGKSSQQIFDLYQHYADQMKAKLPQLFGHLPKTPLEVVPMEA